MNIYQFFLALLWFLTLCPVHAQEEYLVDDFSTTQYIKIYLDSPVTEDDSLKGRVALFDKNNDRVIFESTFSFPHKGYADIQEPRNGKLSIWHQKIIDFMDFNFDGIPDILINEGPMGSYGVPTYRIYIAQDGQYVYDEDFSNLTREFSFELDSINKMIITKDVGGLSHHSASRFRVVNNKPVLTESVSDYYWGPIHVDRFGESVSMYYEDANVNEFGFSLEKDKRSVICFSYNNWVNYTILQRLRDYNDYFNNYIEFLYPTIHSPGEFLYDKTKGMETLTFTNGDAIYTIYESSQKVGIQVATKGKKYDLKGVKSSQYGSIRELLETGNVKNVKKK